MTGILENGAPAFDRRASVLAGHKRGHTLPQALYCDSDIFALDLCRIFHRNWLFVGHASQLARAGDFITYQVSGESLVLVRNLAGDIPALFNVCRHRGARICEGASRSIKGVIQCGFSAQTWPDS
jgi:phenylpropionate dioxygenase-like ring-hydroxylating dioxygenase large terminal subunit